MLILFACLYSMLHTFLLCCFLMVHTARLVFIVNASDNQSTNYQNAYDVKFKCLLVHIQKCKYDFGGGAASGL